MPTTEYGDKIRQVDKVGGKEPRHANCAGCLDGLLENTRSSPIASSLEVLHHLVAGSVVLPKAQGETQNTVSRFYHA